jgi:hypothetical protein
MNKIYYVVIKGRTLESRDLKELLARAVAQKRNLDRKSHLQSQFQGLDPVLRENPCKFADSFL